MQSQYPRWKYSQKYKPIIVNSKEQEDDLGSDWADSPAKFGVVGAPSAHESGESMESYLAKLVPYKIEEKPKAKAKN